MSATPLAHPTVASHARVMPDPEVRERPVRRHFSAEYKLRIVEEAERATQPGDIGSLLRREGLYSSAESGEDRNAPVPAGLRWVVEDRSRTKPSGMRSPD